MVFFRHPILLPRICIALELWFSADVEDGAFEINYQTWNINAFKLKYKCLCQLKGLTMNLKYFNYNLLYTYSKFLLQI